MTKRIEDIQELMAVEAPDCISIYLNPGQLGAPENGVQSRMSFKNSLAACEKELSAKGHSNQETGKLLQPGYDLIENESFWEGLSPGLGVFLHNGQLMTVRMDEPTQPVVHIGGQMYVLPLLPFLYQSSRFFLLSLSLGDADLFLGDDQGLREIALEDLGPQSLTEAIGSDYEQKFLQFRAGQTGTAGGAVFHGHGEGKDDHKAEITTYMRLVNKSLSEILRQETAPLVVACVDYLFPIFRETNSYKHLLEAHLSGNPERASEESLYSRATTLLKPVINKALGEKLGQFKELYATNRTTWDVKDIIRDAVHGQIDTLFVRKGHDVFGQLNPTDNAVILQSEKTSANASLLDLAGRKTAEQGGRVYLLSAEDMPLTDQPVCALLR